MDKLKVTFVFKEPTPKQITDRSFMIDRLGIVEFANAWRKRIEKELSDKVDFSLFTNDEELIMYYSNTGRQKIDYSSIDNPTVRRQIRDVVESVRFVFF
jgi:hypothetical protein